MGGRQSKRSDVPPQLQTSEAQVSRFLEAQRKEHESKRQKETDITEQRQLREVAKTTAELNNNQNERFITAHRKSTLASQRKLQEEVAKRGSQEEAARRKQLEAVTKRGIQEDAARKKQQEEAAKRGIQDDAVRSKQQEEAGKRGIQEEAARRKQLEEAAKRGIQEEAARRKQLEEAAKKGIQEEAARRKQLEEAAKRGIQEEAARRKQLEEAAKRGIQEEAARRKQLEEAAKRGIQEEAARRKQLEEAAKRGIQEEAARRKQLEEAAKRGIQEEAARRKQLEEAAKRGIQEEAARRKQLEEAAKRGIQEEAARRKQQEEVAKRGIQEEAAWRKQLEEAVKRGLQEDADKRALLKEAATRNLPPPFPVPRSEAFSRSRTISRTRELPREDEILRYCCSCYTRSTREMFLCENGHGSCNYCKIEVRACGICRGKLTDSRSYNTENHGAQMKVRCRHSGQGCVVKIKIADMANHVQECPFKLQDCPLAAVYGNCEWSGGIRELSKHFLDKHPNNLLTKMSLKLYFLNTHCDGRYIWLVKQRCHFIFHLKISKNNSKVYMAVQLIGTKMSAMKWVYEIHVYDKSEDRKKFMYTDNCRSSLDDMDDVFMSGECAVLPMWYAKSFFSNESILKFFINNTTTGQASTETTVVETIPRQGKKSIVEEDQ